MSSHLNDKLEAAKDREADRSAADANDSLNSSASGETAHSLNANKPNPDDDDLNKLIENINRDRDVKFEPTMYSSSDENEEHAKSEDNKQQTTLDESFEFVGGNEQKATTSELREESYDHLASVNSVLNNMISDLKSKEDDFEHAQRQFLEQEVTKFADEKHSDFSSIMSSSENEIQSSTKSVDRNKDESEGNFYSSTNIYSTDSNEDTFKEEKKTIEQLQNRFDDIVDIFIDKKVLDDTIKSSEKDNSEILDTSLQQKFNNIVDEFVEKPVSADADFTEMVVKFIEPILNKENFVDTGVATPPSSPQAEKSDAAERPESIRLDSQTADLFDKVTDQFIEKPSPALSSPLSENTIETFNAIIDKFTEPASQKESESDKSGEMNLSHVEFDESIKSNEPCALAKSFDTDNLVNLIEQPGKADFQAIADSDDSPISPRSLNNFNEIADKFTEKPLSENITPKSAGDLAQTESLESSLNAQSLDNSANSDESSVEIKETIVQPLASEGLKTTIAKEEEKALDNSIQSYESSQNESLSVIQDHVVNLSDAVLSESSTDEGVKPKSDSEEDSQAVVSPRTSALFEEIIDKFVEAKPVKSDLIDLVDASKVDTGAEKDLNESSVQSESEKSSSAEGLIEPPDQPEAPEIHKELVEAQESENDASSAAELDESIRSSEADNVNYEPLKDSYDDSVNSEPEQPLSPKSIDNFEKIVDQFAEPTIQQEPVDEQNESNSESVESTHELKSAGAIITDNSKQPEDDAAADLDISKDQAESLSTADSESNEKQSEASPVPLSPVAVESLQTIVDKFVEQPDQNESANESIKSEQADSVSSGIKDLNESAKSQDEQVALSPRTSVAFNSIVDRFVEQPDLTDSLKSEDEKVIISPRTSQAFDMLVDQFVEQPQAESAENVEKTPSPVRVDSPIAESVSTEDKSSENIQNVPEQILADEDKYFEVLSNDLSANEISGENESPVEKEYQNESSEKLQDEQVTVSPRTSVTVNSIFDQFIEKPVVADESVKSKDEKVTASPRTSQAFGTIVDQFVEQQPIQHEPEILNVIASVEPTESVNIIQEHSQIDDLSKSPEQEDRFDKSESPANEDPTKSENLNDSINLDKQKEEQSVSAVIDDSFKSENLPAEFINEVQNESSERSEADKLEESEIFVSESEEKFVLNKDPEESNEQETAEIKQESKENVRNTDSKIPDLQSALETSINDESKKSLNQFGSNLDEENLSQEGLAQSLKSFDSSTPLAVSFDTNNSNLFNKMVGQFVEAAAPIDEIKEAESDEIERVNQSDSAENSSKSSQDNLLSAQKPEHSPESVKSEDEQVTTSQRTSVAFNSMVDQFVEKPAESSPEKPESTESLKSDEKQITASPLASEAFNTIVDQFVEKQPTQDDVDVSNENEQSNLEQSAQNESLKSENEEIVISPRTSVAFNSIVDQFLKQPVKVPAVEAEKSSSPIPIESTSLEAPEEEKSPENVELVEQTPVAEEKPAGKSSSSIEDQEWQLVDKNELAEAENSALKDQSSGVQDQELPATIADEKVNVVESLPPVESVLASSPNPAEEIEIVSTTDANLSKVEADQVEPLEVAMDHSVEEIGQKVLRAHQSLQDSLKYAQDDSIAENIQEPVTLENDESNPVSPKSVDELKSIVNSFIETQPQQRAGFDSNESINSEKEIANEENKKESLSESAKSDEEKHAFNELVDKFIEAPSDQIATAEINAESMDKQDRDSPVVLESKVEKPVSSERVEEEKSFEAEASDQPVSPLTTENFENITEQFIEPVAEAFRSEEVSQLSEILDQFIETKENLAENVVEVTPIQSEPDQSPSEVEVKQPETTQEQTESLNSAPSNTVIDTENGEEYVMVDAVEASQTALAASQNKEFVYDEEIAQMLAAESETIDRDQMLSMIEAVSQQYEQEREQDESRANGANLDDQVETVASSPDKDVSSEQANEQTDPQIVETVSSAASVNDSVKSDEPIEDSQPETEAQVPEEQSPVTKSSQESSPEEFVLVEASGALEAVVPQSEKQPATGLADSLEEQQVPGEDQNLEQPSLEAVEETQPVAGEQPVELSEAEVPEQSINRQDEQDLVRAIATSSIVAALIKEEPIDEVLEPVSNQESEAEAVPVDSSLAVENPPVTIEVAELKSEIKIEDSVSVAVETEAYKNDSVPQTTEAIQEVEIRASPHASPAAVVSVSDYVQVERAHQRSCPLSDLKSSSLTESEPFSDSSATSSLVEAAKPNELEEIPISISTTAKHTKVIDYRYSNVDSHFSTTTTTHTQQKLSSLTSKLNLDLDSLISREEQLYQLEEQRKKLHQQQCALAATLNQNETFESANFSSKLKFFANISTPGAASTTTTQSAQQQTTSSTNPFYNNDQQTEPRPKPTSLSFLSSSLMNKRYTNDPNLIKFEDDYDFADNLTPASEAAFLNNPDNFDLIKVSIINKRPITPDLDDILNETCEEQYMDKSFPYNGDDLNGNLYDQKRLSSLDPSIANEYDPISTYR
jgi:hypothetical protein